MRFSVGLIFLLTVGCGRAEDEGRGGSPANGPRPPSRKTGSDWPGFLGPHGNSVSSEKGILSPWPVKGLRVVWHRQVGTGYAMPSISQGRLFQFDRHRDTA